MGPDVAKDFTRAEMGLNYGGGRGGHVWDKWH